MGEEIAQRTMAVVTLRALEICRVEATGSESVGWLVTPTRGGAEEWEKKRKMTNSHEAGG